MICLLLTDRCFCPHYLAFDRRENRAPEQSPASDNAFDAALLCYVLHHAEDVRIVLSEMRRVLRDGGLAVIYEDIPGSWWDRLVCEFHDRQWRGHTGPCTFHRESE